MPRYVRIVWRSLALISHILLGCFLVPIAREPAPSGGSRVRSKIIAWWHLRLLHILHFEINFTGAAPAGAALFIANHVSWVDIPLLGYLAPAHFLAKDDVRVWPVIGWLASSTGTVFMKRGGGQSQAAAAAISRKLQLGDKLALFPEGTTTDGQSVRLFFPRLLAAVIDTEIPIVPVTIRYHINDQYDPLAPFLGEQSLAENILGLLGRKTNQVQVHFGQPLQHQGEDRKALAEKVRGAIVNSLNAMVATQ